MLLKVHKNTVRTWLKSGLEPIDNRRPILILGRKLSSFLHARRQRGRQRCCAGQFYCFRCREPRSSAATLADYVPITSRSGNLTGLCSKCGARMCRLVSFQKLAVAGGDLLVQVPQAQQRIVEGADPCLNCDLEREPDAQPGQ